MNDMPTDLNGHGAVSPLNETETLPLTLEKRKIEGAQGKDSDLDGKWKEDRGLHKSMTK